ncbi:universal stress protein [Maribacter sp. PR1]|uniref:Universal stress protein n=1 Tax=Maribacter cobaltidurans TaxID=1178778 RepID=A0ABU7IV46_9FLAO|nr:MULTISPECIES: universal stress protein [Maribacter]MDC6389008.1 universal stress protein [Maribacter sp. PR1]MEE1976396.1 universal stress protein [Maribacter cobaltidurans]
MTRILLPTDFSDNSIKAIAYGLSLYKNVDCTFYILNTYMPPVYHTEYILGSPGQIGLGDIIKEESKKNLKELKSKLENEFKNPLHTFVTHSAFNMLTNEVTQITEAEDIDLVIMGTKGATGAQEILLGTNTVHVLKNSKCPVLAIPQDFEYEEPSVILFPTDYEVSFTKEKLATLLKIVKEHRSEINVMHVFTQLKLNPTQIKNRKSLETLLGNNGLFHDVESDEIITAINKFQVKEKIDFLVMIQNKHTFFERLFIEPTIKKIGFHVNVPFLVIPEK